MQNIAKNWLQIVLGQGSLEQQHIEQSMERHGLKIGALVLLVIEQTARNQTEDLIEQVDLIDVVRLVSGVLDEQDDELDEGI